MSDLVPIGSGWKQGINSLPTSSVKKAARTLLEWVIETAENEGLDKDALLPRVRPEGQLTADDPHRVCLLLFLKEGGFRVDAILKVGSTAYVELTRLVVRFFTGPWFMTDNFRQMYRLADELVDARKNSRQPNAAPTLRVSYDERVGPNGRVLLQLGDRVLLDEPVPAGGDPTSRIVALLDQVLVPDPAWRMEAQRDPFGLPTYSFPSFATPDDGGRRLFETDDMEDAARLIAFGATDAVEVRATAISNLLRETAEIGRRLKRRVDSELYRIPIPRRTRRSTGAALALPAPDGVPPNGVPPAGVPQEVPETDDPDWDDDEMSDDEGEDEDEDEDDTDEEDGSADDADDAVPSEDAEDDDDDEDVMSDE